MSSALKMTFRLFPNHTEETKEKVLDHIDNYVLEDISYSELASLARHALLRDWLKMSKKEIESDLAEYQYQEEEV